MPGTFKHSFLILSMILLSGTVIGCASAPLREPETETAPVWKKADWIKTVQGNLSNSLCGEGEIFRSCFSITESECRERVQEVTLECESEYDGRIPMVVNHSQGRVWGGQIGQCAGESLYQVLDTGYAINDSNRCQQLVNQM